MQLTAQRFTVKHLLKPIARAQFIEETLRNKFEGFQAFTSPLQPPPMSLGRFADEPSAAGELRSRLRRGNRVRSDPRRVLSGLWGGCGGSTARLPSAAAPESSGSLGLSWCR